MFLLREPPDRRDRRLLSGGASDLIGTSTASSVLQMPKVVEAADGLIRSLNPCPPTSLSLCAQGPRQEDLTVSYKYGSFVPTRRELGPGSLLVLCRMLNVYSDQRRTEQEGEDQHSVLLLPCVAQHSVRHSPFLIHSALFIGWLLRTRELV